MYGTYVIPYTYNVHPAPFVRDAKLQHEEIQIHHIRDLGHWVTSSSVGQSVAVYDSKHLGGHLSSSLTHLLALIYRLLAKTEDEDGEKMDPTLFIDVPYAQQQNGVSDCGLSNCFCSPFSPW